MPWPRLSPKQRAWLFGRDDGERFVGVLVLGFVAFFMGLGGWIWYMNVHRHDPAVNARARDVLISSTTDAERADLQRLLVEYLARMRGSAVDQVSDVEFVPRWLYIENDVESRYGSPGNPNRDLSSWGGDLTWTEHEKGRDHLEQKSCEIGLRFTVQRVWKLGSTRNCAQMA
jgi:hypothetical protein